MSLPATLLPAPVSKPPLLLFLFLLHLLHFPFSPPSLRSPPPAAAMGNALRFLCGECCGEKPSPHHHAAPPQALGPHGVTVASVGVSVLAQDILHFDITSQVPDRLSQYVVSSKKAQANWFRKLSVAWKEASPPPRESKEASKLVILTLKNHQKADVQGLLAFYGLPYLDNFASDSAAVPSSLPEGVKLKFDTLPVDSKSVVDGDGINVFVDTADSRESSMVPLGVHELAVERSNAQAAKNYKLANAVHKNIVKAGYRVIVGPNNEEVLAKKYRIRLRGIDAPESTMPYGKEALQELTKLVEGKRLQIFVYGEDQYGRSVGDVYCNGVFVQEVMLKRGYAWHYAAYDKRPELEAWEKSARAARRGLWASVDPQEPWEYRKERRNGG